MTAMTPSLSRTSDMQTDRSGRAALVDFRQESGPGTLAGINIDFLVVIREWIASQIVMGRCRFRVCFTPSGRSSFGNMGHISPAATNTAL